MPTFYAGQADYIAQLNALWDRGTASLYGTSTDSETISLGAKNLTTQAGLQFYTGSQITITNSADLTKYMSGVVVAYDSVTGSLDVNITSINGSGTFNTWTITLSGAAGAAGIADNISIGTVTQGTAAASITGTSPNKYLNLVLQKGDTGDIGAAGAPNVLSIGTVVSGVSAAASITGTSPSQVLNLTLPKGDTGNTGATGAAGLVARGAWNGATAYVTTPSVDWVTYNGSSYYRKVDGTTGTTPDVDTTNWGLLAQKGADGSGAVASVTASAPIASSGGANPDISIATANSTTTGALSSTDWNTFNSKGSGTVTNVTFTGANGFTGSVATNTTTPAISVGTSVSGILKGNGTAVSAATSGTDYSAGTASLATGIVKSTTATGALSIAVAGDFPTLNQNTTGTASNVTGVVAGANGGTGVNNSGKTITLGGNLTTSGAFATTIVSTAATNVTLPASGTLGYLGIPSNSQSTSYTIVSSDEGKHILHPSADTSARTFTIPSNASVPFPVGAAVTFINQHGGGIITISISSDVMRLAGAGTTGNRSLAANGIATVVKINTTEWIISGVGLT